MSISRTARYAVLFHDGVAAPHFDLLIELQEGASLATWRVPVWPVFEPTTATRLRDHRRAYLEYQGEIAGGRGFARRVDGGDCEVGITSAGEIELEFDGMKLLLRQVHEEEWIAIRADAV